MAANEGPRQDISLDAAADLSALQYNAVKLTADKTVGVTTAQGEQCFGILQNAPDAAGKAALVAIGGRAKALLSDTVTFMAELTSNGSGPFENAASGDYVQCTALEAGVSGDIIDVIVGNPGSLHVLA